MEEKRCVIDVCICQLFADVSAIVTERMGNQILLTIHTVRPGISQGKAVQQAMVQEHTLQVHTIVVSTLINTIQRDMVQAHASLVTMPGTVRHMKTMMAAVPKSRKDSGFHTEMA